MVLMGWGPLLLLVLVLEYFLLVALVGRWVFGRCGLVPVFTHLSIYYRGPNAPIQKLILSFFPDFLLVRQMDKLGKGCLAFPDV